MNQSQLPPPKPREVTINGQRYKMVAFYYPGKDTSWDTVYQGQFLCNFYSCSMTLTINGITATFSSAEAAFQATKWWNNPTVRAQFEKTTDGQEAFDIKQKLANPDYTYAGLCRDGAMERVLTQKFSDPAFKQALLLTEDAYLLEHNEKKGRDDYWSDDWDGSGYNMLGKLLMSIRESLGGAGKPSGNYTVADFTAKVEVCIT
jgi:predicted NAD-dependent protein-ADP-ribosyltransferase YbiA (DUF1768 family)